MRLFPSSGEINRMLNNPSDALRDAEDAYSKDSLVVDYADGLSMEFRDWRFNLRSSNTEPVVRLNVESRGDEALMRAKTREILSLLDSRA
jgi:phosphomannomutase